MNATATCTIVLPTIISLLATLPLWGTQHLLLLQENSAVQPSPAADANPTVTSPHCPQKPPATEEQQQNNPSSPSEETTDPPSQQPSLIEQATSTIIDHTALDAEAIRAIDLSNNPKVWIIPIQGPILQNTVYHVRRSLKDAQAAGAEAIILDMNTPGGEIGSVLKIMEILLKFRPLENTYTFINPDAYSGGAFIAAATRHIIMSPSGVVGAARIVAATGQEIAQRVEEKFRSAVKAKLRSACEIQGHRIDVFQAMVGDEPEIRIDGKLINPQNAVLTLTAKEAARKYGNPPKPLLAQAIVADIEELLKLAGLENANVVRSDPTGFEQIAGWIVLISPILLLMGIVGIYVELRTPGFGLPGIVGILCFLLFFFGHHIAGLSGQEATIALAGLFLLGLLLIALELFVIPGTFLPAIIGAFCIIIALLLTMADYWPNQSLVPKAEALFGPALNLAVAVLGATLLSLLLAKFLPAMPLFREAIVGKPLPSPLAIHPNYTGQIGVTLTDLHPAGKVSLGDEVIDALSQGEFIPAKTQVRVIEMRGASAVVERIR